MTSKNNISDDDLTRKLLIQRRVGQIMVAVGIIALLLSPVVILYLGPIVDLGVGAQDDLTEDEQRELEEAMESGDYEKQFEYAIRSLSFDSVAGTMTKGVLFAMPIHALLLILGGGYLITHTEKTANILDLEGYPDNPSVRDELRNDDP